MPRHEDILVTIWDDPDFEALSRNAAWLYIWSWTNLRCGMAGLYKVSLRAMTQSKVPEGSVPAALEELAETDFAFYEDAVLWVRSRVKHLTAPSPAMARSVAKDVRVIPTHHPLRARFLAYYGDLKWLRDALGPLRAETFTSPQEDRESGTVPRPSPDGPMGGGGVVVTTSTDNGNVPSQRPRDPLPADFPAELRPHLTAVYRVLRDLAERSASQEVKPAALANVVMARPRKPLVRAAHDCAAHWEGKHVRDTVAAYRNWLDRCDDLAATEPLGSGGGPEGAKTPEPQSPYLRRKMGLDP